MKFRALFVSTLYVRVSRNQLRVRHLETKREVAVSPRVPFSTRRLLVGNLTSAEESLQQAVDRVQKGRWYPSPPAVVIHPLEMVEDGLSEVEERVLRELAAGGAAARKVVIWIGHELSDAEVLRRAKAG